MRKFLLIILLSPIHSFCQDSLSLKEIYERGIKEYELENFELARDYFLKAAQLGDPASQNKLGMIYATGKGAPLNGELALRWLTKAADQNYRNALDNLGWMYQFGRGVEIDFLKATLWYKRSAELGSAYGQNRLGYLYREGKGVNQNYEESLKWLRRSSEQGNAQGQFLLGVMYDNGYGVKLNKELAFKLFYKAATQGSEDAQFNVGRMYEKGDGVMKDETEAIKWYLLSANNGSSSSQLNLALMLEDGRGGARDYEQAAKWYMKAAEQGLPTALFRLGRLYENGQGVKKNISKAIDYYLQGAEKGNARAQSQLGYLFVYADSSQRKLNEGIEWLKKACEQNNAVAQLNLGYAYHNGIGLNQDIIQAAKYYSLSAKQGNSTAKKNLRIIYEDKLIKEKLGISELDSLLVLPLKHYLSQQELDQVAKESISCFSINPTITFNITSEDLMPSKNRRPEEPASLKRVAELQKQLKKDPINFNLNFSLAEAYLKLNKRHEASEFFDKALAIANQTLNQNPHDSIQFFKLSLVYAKQNEYKKAADELNKYLLKHNDDDAKALLILCYSTLGDLENENKFEMSLIQKTPEEPMSYLSLSMREALTHLQDTSGIATKKIDDIGNFYLLKNAIEKYPSNIKLQFLHQELRLMVLFYKVFLASAPTLSKGFYFKLSPYDIAETKKLERYFLNILSQKNIDSKFTLLKLLVIINTFTSEWDNGIKHCTEALRIKNSESSNHWSNKSEIYDILTTIYILKKDTIGAMKIVEGKLSKSDDVYQAAGDYCLLAQFKCWKNNFSGAKKDLLSALDIDPLTQEAYIGLASLEILNGDIKKAQDLLLKASSCGEDNASIRTLSGIIWIKLGEGKSANQSFNEGLRLDKDYEPAKKLLKRYFVEPLK